MNKIIIFVGSLLIFAVPASAQIAQGGSYALNQSVIAGGGGTSSDTSNGNTFKVEGTIGEPVAGMSSSNSPYSVKGSFFSAQALAPTAAGVTVSGRVIDTVGKGIRNVVIAMTDSSGTIRTTVSTAFGHFSFADVPAGETYIFNVTAKRFTFSQPVQAHSITEDTSDIIFIGETIGVQSR